MKIMKKLSKVPAALYEHAREFGKNVLGMNE